MQAAVLPWRYNVEIGTANSLHASAYYGKYNIRFDFGCSWFLYKSISAQIFRQMIEVFPKKVLVKNLCFFVLQNVKYI